MNPSHGITQRKKSMEEWPIPELKERDIARGVIATPTTNLPVGESAHTVTKEDIKQSIVAIYCRKISRFKMQ